LEPRDRPLGEGAAADLRIERLRKTFGAFTAVDEVSLQVRHGEFVSLLGPSGCGKTTILRMIAGLIEPDSGRIVLADEDITERPVHRRNLGLVFQSYALFPHMSVFENVAFGLRRRRVPEAEIRRRVTATLELVRLGPQTDRFPRQLSGGQQQRVALARAVVTEPRLLLLDEPLSNLDALLRDEMRVELKRLQEELRITTIFVTHDQAEALTLSDRIAVLSQGRLEQMGTPEAIYHGPATPFVAGFIGRSNLLAGVVVGHAEQGVRVRVGEGRGLELVAAAPDSLRPGDAVQASLRHERIHLAGAPTPGMANSFPGRIVFRAFAGPVTQYVVQLEGGIELQVETPSAAGRLEREADVQVELAPEAVILLPAAGRAA
jgi:putative spermidine/putrescine transport system ATP-binding protein